jgi:putative FmdB family regulatory protein
MPTYQFECKTCEQTISELVPLNEELKTPKCLKCQENMQRIFAIPSVTFRGSGWGSDQ